MPDGPVMSLEVLIDCYIKNMMDVCHALRLIDERIKKLESKMALVDDLKTAVAAQATAITELQAKVAAIPPIVDQTELQAAVTAVEANTTAIAAITTVVP